MKILKHLTRELVRWWLRDRLLDLSSVRPWFDSRSWVVFQLTYMTSTIDAYNQQANPVA